MRRNVANLLIKSLETQYKSSLIGLELDGGGGGWLVGGSCTHHVLYGGSCTHHVLDEGVGGLTMYCMEDHALIMYWMKGLEDSQCTVWRIINSPCTGWRGWRTHHVLYGGSWTHHVLDEGVGDSPCTGWRGWSTHYVLYGGSWTHHLLYGGS